MDHTLKLASQRDIEGLFDIEYELFPDNNFNERTLHHEVMQGTSWVLYVGGKLVGYALCRSDGYLIDILRLGVREQFRGAGLGTRLLQEAVNSAPKAMLTVRKDNGAALRLYHRHDFEIVGVLPQHDSWVMLRKPLSLTKPMKTSSW